MSLTLEQMRQRLEALERQANRLQEDCFTPEGAGRPQIMALSNSQALRECLEEFVGLIEFARGQLERTP